MDSRRSVSKASDVSDSSFAARKRRSSSAIRRPSVFESPKPRRTHEFESPPRSLALASPSPAPSDAFVNVYAMLCQHGDEKLQEATISAGSEVRGRFSPSAVTGCGDLAVARRVPRGPPLTPH